MNVIIGETSILEKFFKEKFFMEHFNKWLNQYLEVLGNS